MSWWDWFKPKPKPPKPTPAKVRIDVVAVDKATKARLPGTTISLHGDVGGAQTADAAGWTMWQIDADKKGKRVEIQFAKDGYTFEPIVLDPWDGKERLSPNDYGGEGVATAPPVPVSKRTGLVRAQGKALADDGGTFLALFHSQFWLPWAMAFDRERGLKNLDHLLARGSQGARIFCVSGDGGANVNEDSWYDRTLNPGVNGFPAWRQAMVDTFTALKDRHARAIATIFGTIGRLDRNGRAQAVLELAAVFSQFKEQILYAELSNEAKLDADEAREHVATLRSKCPWLLVTSTAADWSGQSNVSAQHPERKVTGEGGMWEHCEQMYEAFVLSGAPYPGSVQEPIGPQSSVAEDDDPARLVCDAVTGFVCGAPVYVYHCGAGIRGGGEADRNRGRCQNVWEHPTLDATWKGLVAALDVLPADVAGFGHVSHSHPKNDAANGGAFPFDTAKLADLDEGVGFLKFYTCSEGVQSGRFAGSLMGIVQDVPLTAHKRMTVLFADCAKGEASVWTLEPGATFNVTQRGGVYVSGRFL